MKTIDLSKETEPIKIIVGKTSKLSLNVDYDDPEIGEVLITSNKDPFDLVPKSWEEYCEKLAYEFDDERAYCNLSGLCPIKDIDAFIAMFKLRRLWHEWTKVLGEPKLNGDDEYFAICHNLHTQNLVVIPKAGWNNCLAFTEEEYADKFIECFPELLEKAKILL